MATNVLTNGDPRETLLSDPVTTLTWEGTLETADGANITLFEVPNSTRILDVFFDVLVAAGTNTPGLNLGFPQQLPTGTVFWLGGSNLGSTGRISGTFTPLPITDNSEAGQNDPIPKTIPIRLGIGTSNDGARIRVQVVCDRVVY